MNRMKFTAFLWTLLLIMIFLKSVQPASVTKSTSKATRSPTRSTTTKSTTTRSTTVAPSRSTAKSSSSRNTPRPKKRTTTTTTTTPPSVETAIKDILKTQLNTSSSGSKKKQNTRTTTTTTLSPLEIMNRIYQNHGMASHSSHSHYSSHHSHSSPSSSSSSSSSSSKRKPQPDTSSSMDDIYRLHALAMSQSHSNTHKVSSSSSSSGSSGGSSSYSSSSSSNKPSSSSSSSMENIYQKHSSMPSSMHHIMSQHSMSHSNSRPQKTKLQPLKESSSTSLTTFMQPLLKQLSPVGAGISVILAPLLLFHGFLTFFSNISQYLDGFSKIILPHRKPTGGQFSKPVGSQGSSQSQEYFQNLGHAYLKRQPRDWLDHLRNMKEVHDITELILRSIKESETQQMNK